ncbi:MAG: Flp pilus assembly protein CpaB [Emcibacter sp.]|nr:Flp pilus assembly protein CpaB [Emcibacter sp.]
MNINIRSIILIVIALVIAGVTAMLARNLVSTPKQSIDGTGVVTEVRASKMKILVAAKNIPLGHFIKDEDMTWQSWPDETVHDSYIKQDSGIKKESFDGAVAKSDISAGEPILDNRLVKPGNRGFMAAVLPVGMRAVTVRITDISGNAGFIFPGDRVDIVLTHDIAIKEKKQKSHVSETVLKNIRVLAINQRTDSATRTPSVGKTATLEVTSKDAEKIALLKSMGTLTLVLRSLGAEDETTEHAAQEKPTATWDSEVSNQISNGAANSPAGHNVSVEIFRGGTKKNQKVDFNQLFNQALNAQNGNNTDEDTATTTDTEETEE